ncbi:MAG: hypothetical protein ACE5JX_06350 [Acidobacteriota bacterium]
MIDQSPLPFAGETSTYAGTIDLQKPGDFQLEVLAMDVQKANIGHFVQPLTVGSRNPKTPPPQVPK